MQAPGLLEIHPLVEGGAQRVARRGVGGEEPVGVVVRAANLMRLDDRVGSVGAETKRVRAVSQLLGRLAVDHRPLVHAEASGLRRPSRGRREQAADEAHGVDSARVDPARSSSVPAEVVA